MKLILERIVYGQLQTICHGYHATAHDNWVSPYNDYDDEHEEEESNTGSVTLKTLNFKCAARNGVWHAKKIMMESERGPELLGYMIHHSDIDPQELMDEVKKVPCNRPHDNPNVGLIYWSSWGGHEGLGIPDNIPGLGDNMKIDEDMMGSRIMLFDRDNMLKDGYGVHIPVKYCMYENGYLIYSGEKHDTFTDSDELVALVYDSDEIIGHACPEDPSEGYHNFEVLEIDGTETSQ
ncbi:hypothetical protein GQ42DRAFT_176083 [Ramicandelaber brevisporus]|nr:hypothetical protein GQ42DRAFT_176083 [Ramicandelaber brevisporus]